MKIYKGEQGEQFHPYFFNTVGVRKKFSLAGVL